MSTEQPEYPQLSPLIIDGPPWEKKHDIGFFTAFIETVKVFLIRPANTFSVMRRKAGIGDALVYTVALQVFSFLWIFAMTDSSPENLLPQSPELREMLDLPDNISQIMVLVYPLSVMLLQFVTAYSVHLALTWRNLQIYDFTLVFRIFAYASGTAAILSLIPAIGGFISVMTTIYLSYIGLRTIYAIQPGSFAITAALGIIITLGLYILIVIGITMGLILISFVV